MECYIREFGCRYFFIRSCSIFACPELASGTCINGATFTVRNSQLNPQQPKQMHAPLFLVCIYIESKVYFELVYLNELLNYDYIGDAIIK